MQTAGRAIHPDDLPPALGWETGVWWLFLRVHTQWRTGAMGQRTGLDYGPAIALIRHLRWNMALVLELLQAVELQMLPRAEE